MAYNMPHTVCRIHKYYLKKMFLRRIRYQTLCLTLEMMFCVYRCNENVFVLS